MIAVAVVIMVAGAALSLIGGASARARANQLGTDVPGIPFKAMPAAGYLRHVEAPGEPPAGVVKALTVPASSIYESYSNGDGNAGQFARSVTFAVPAKPATVARFYLLELKGAHWSMQFDGLAKREGAPGPAQWQRWVRVGRRRRHLPRRPDLHSGLGRVEPDLDHLGDYDGVPGSKLRLRERGTAWFGRGALVPTRGLHGPTVCRR